MLGSDEWWSPQGDRVPADTFAVPPTDKPLTCRGCKHLLMPTAAAPRRHCAFKPEKRRTDKSRACYLRQVR